MCARANLNTTTRGPEQESGVLVHSRVQMTREEAEEEEEVSSWAKVRAVRALQASSHVKHHSNLAGDASEPTL